MNEAHEPRAPVVSPVLDVATLVNRATNCKLLARKRLGELTRQRKAVQQQLRQFEARGHWLQAGKRERDEEAAPAAATSSTAGSGGATQSGEAAQMDVDVDHQPAHKRARRIDNGKPIPLTVMSNDEAPASVEGIGSSEPDRGVRSRPAARVGSVTMFSCCPALQASLRGHYCYWWPWQSRKWWYNHQILEQIHVIHKGDMLKRRLTNMQLLCHCPSIVSWLTPAYRTLSRCKRTTTHVSATARCLAYFATLCGRLASKRMPFQARSNKSSKKWSRSSNRTVSETFP
eukprot:scaffold117344_cov31-Tisochrysis_lutea.AAC.3